MKNVTSSPRLTPLNRLILPALLSILIVACSPGSAQEQSGPEPGSTTPADPGPTAAEGQLTVGDLVDRMDDAWPTISSMRITSISGPVPTDSENGTPVAQGTVTVEEWVAPNTRRIVELMGDNVVNEHVFIDGKVYMWGMFVGTSVAPEVGPNTWVTLDPEVIPPDTPVGYRVAHIARDPGSPFANLLEETRQMPVTESGAVQVGARRCTLYTYVTTTQMGEQIDYELSLDENDLPCQYVQRAGGVQNSSVFEINSPDIQIIAPDAPTPVSGTPEG